ncbi:MAG: family 16 glycoside hydrolase, partial [Pseudomonadota bacterium]|nr:family 16 glycoside hydrolase [Pseudomonadota bacterium]
HWNVYRIVMDGDHLTVELNNEQTVDVRDDKLVSGPFALQWARGEMRFRKVQIREL